MPDFPLDNLSAGACAIACDLVRARVGLMADHREGRGRAHPLYRADPPRWRKLQHIRCMCRECGWPRVKVPGRAGRLVLMNPDRLTPDLLNRVRRHAAELFDAISPPKGGRAHG